MLKRIKALVTRFRASKIARPSRNTVKSGKERAKVESLKNAGIPSQVTVLVTEDIRVGSGPAVTGSVWSKIDGVYGAYDTDAVDIKNTLTSHRLPLVAILEEDADISTQIDEGPFISEINRLDDYDRLRTPGPSKLLDKATQSSNSTERGDDSGGKDKPSMLQEAGLDTVALVSSLIIDDSFEKADPINSFVAGFVPDRPPLPKSPALPESISEGHQPTPPLPIQRSPTSSLDGNIKSYPIYITSDASPAPQPHIRDKTWLIPVSVLLHSSYAFEYQFGGLLGEGGFGKVLLALNLDTHAQHAVKVIALRRVRSRREAVCVTNEVKVLWKVWRAGKQETPFLGRPASVKDWVWQYRGNIHLVLEYYQGGDLGRGTKMHPELRDPRRFKLMVAEVLIAMLALHNMGIIHHDLKPTNILVDAEGHCVLTDYGGSCFLSEEFASSSYVASASPNLRLENQVPIITVRYAAPEVLHDGDSAGQGYGTSADFWSLGITLFELATGRDFIDEPDEDAAISMIQRNEIDREQLVLLSAYPGLRHFVSALLDVDPVQRLQGHTVKSHGYFGDFTQLMWAEIFLKQRPPFQPNKQHPVNPRNTSYDVIERPGESLLDDANEDIVCRWLAQNGMGLPHHRASVFHQRHRNNARVGLPERSKRTEKTWQDPTAGDSAWSKSE
ncbi:hypothetical protein EW145_g7268 [Phellinidium pouzarii]|uniref:non-specific serine/threonine protein kinase n=1 Tax=Phellinidium pouzarii TaxID=167371 RepID=A0A4S4KMV1_9AGAM|nr:hypothetical protein EW145_g7268 [Phellinidium pouzarii]